MRPVCFRAQLGVFEEHKILCLGPAGNTRRDKKVTNRVHTGNLVFYNGTELVAGLSMFADSCASGASHTDLNHRHQRQSHHVLALN